VSALRIAVHIGLAILPTLLVSLVATLLAALLVLLAIDGSLALLILLALALIDFGAVFAVVAALAILAHGIFSCERPGSGTGKKRTKVGLVPGFRAQVIENAILC